MSDDVDVAAVVAVAGAEIERPAEPATHWACLGSGGASRGCGKPLPTYVGRCPTCRQVNSMREVPGPCPVPAKALPAAPRDSFVGLSMGYRVEDAEDAAQPIGEVVDDYEPCDRIATGVDALDRVLGRRATMHHEEELGAAMGGVVLLGGKPGSRKSSVLLQSCGNIAARRRKVLYVTGEQMKSELVGYAERLGILSETVRRYLIVHRTKSYESFVEAIDQHDPAVVVMDSLNKFRTMRVDPDAGDVRHAEEIMEALYELTVERQIATFVVSQVTKDGDLASSMKVQHASHVIAKMRALQDPVERAPFEAMFGATYPDGDPRSFLELVCPEKNRFGREGVRAYFVTDESGVLQSVDFSD
jgi:DNA repair protein RadA/Sms